MSSFVGLGVAIKKAGLIDSMCIIEKFAHRRKNKPGRLLRLYVCRSCRVKPLDESFAALNHLVGLH